MTHRNSEPLEFQLPADELPVLPNEPASPWLLAPPEAGAAFRRMQSAGVPLGAHAGMRVRRGVVTGANDIFVIEHAEPKLNNLAVVRARGDRVARKAGRPARDARSFRALIEGESLCPLVRGSGVASWRFDSPDWLLWLHDDASAEAVAAPPRTHGYLNRHATALRARSGWRPGQPLGAICHATPDTLGAKVLWHDLAETLKAVAVPARVRGLHGRDRPLVPLNTVYFIPVDSYEHALPLAALLNSTLVRTFARAVAQRAKDLRFRFLAWTVRLIPLPEDWHTRPAAERLLRLSRRAHERGALDPSEREDLDAAVASLYGLEAEHRRAIERFDNWLRGDSP